tara:strand:- start:60 stop:323 length:264 start_codon:yes stop_codon:yes gene_type:complete
MSIIKIDIEKAKEMHRERIRYAREPLLEELDVKFTRALEDGADTKAIVDKKKALRDAPADSAIAAAKTTDELKAQWNTGLLGDTAYN